MRRSHYIASVRARTPLPDVSATLAVHSDALCQHIIIANGISLGGGMFDGHGKQSGACAE